MDIGLHVKYSFFLSDFNVTWIFLDRFSKNTQISNFMKIRPVGAGLFFADRRTDMTNLIIAFRNFANAPKNELYTSQKTLSLRHSGWRFMMSQRLHFSLDAFI